MNVIKNVQLLDVGRVPVLRLQIAKVSNRDRQVIYMHSIAFFILLLAGASVHAQDVFLGNELLGDYETNTELAAPAPVNPVPAPEIVATPSTAGASCCLVEDIYAKNAIVSREKWTETRPVPLYDDKCYDYFSLLRKTRVDRKDRTAYVRALQDVYKGGRIVLHHTASSQATAQDVLNDHIGNDWGDMGYHFYIRKDCTVLEGRPLHMMGTHAGHMPTRIGECLRNGQASYSITNDFDFKAIGIVMEGNSNNTDVKCGAVLKKLIDSLHSTFGIDRIGGHGHYRVGANDGTDCPGDHMKSWMTENLGSGSGMKLEGTGDGSGTMSAIVGAANGSVELSILQKKFTETMGFKQVTEAGRIPPGTIPVNDISDRSIECTACQE